MPQTELPEPPETRYVPEVQKFPGQSLDPDQVRNFIESELMSRLIVAPPGDKEEYADELAASYGG